MNKIIKAAAIALMAATGGLAANPGTRGVKAATPIPGYFADKLDSKGFVNKSKLSQATHDTQQAAKFYEFNYNTTFFEQMLEKNMIADYHAPGPFEYERMGETYTIESHFYFTSFFETEDVDFPGVYYDEYATIIEKTYTTDFFVESTTKFISFKVTQSNDKGWKFFFDYLMNYIPQNVVVPLVKINGQAIATLSRDVDNQIVINQRGSYIYFDESQKEMYIDYPNIEHINSMAFLSYETLENANELVDNPAPANTTFNPMTFYGDINGKVYYSSLEIDTLDHAMGTVEFKPNARSKANANITSLTVNGQAYNNLTEIETTGEGRKKYKINNYIAKNANQELIVNDYTTNTEGKSKKSKLYEYSDRAAWHQSRYSAFENHFLDYTSLYFSFWDYDTKEWVKRDITAFSFVYFEGRNDKAKNDPRLALETTMSNAAELSKINGKYPLTWWDKEENRAQWNDRYGREWRLHQTNAADNIVTEILNGGTETFVLYTFKPGNLVWDISVVYLTYRTAAGETYNLSGYQDNLHGVTDDNGDVVVKDGNGKIHNDKTVNEDGLIVNKDDGTLVDLPESSKNRFERAWDRVTNWFDNNIGNPFSDIISAVKLTITVVIIGAIVYGFFRLIRLFKGSKNGK